MSLHLPDTGAKPEGDDSVVIWLLPTVILRLSRKNA